MEARYKVVVDVGDGNIIIGHVKRVRVERELPNGKFRFEFSTWEPDLPGPQLFKYEPEGA